MIWGYNERKEKESDKRTLLNVVANDFTHPIKFGWVILRFIFLELQIFAVRANWTRRTFLTHI